MKKLITLLLIAAMILGLVACASNETPASSTQTEENQTSGESENASDVSDTDDDAPYIVFVCALMGNSTYEEQNEAARKAAEDYGVNLEIMGPSEGSQTLLNDSVAAIENAITLEPDAIICEPWDPGLYDVVRRATAAGIPVFCVSNTTDNEDDYVTCIGTANYETGYAEAEMIAEATGGKANIMIMCASLAANNQVEMINGLSDCVAEKYPDMKVVTTVAHEGDVAKAASLFQDNFNTYPEIDTVVMFSGVGGASGALVAKEMGKEVRIIDIDAQPETIDNIKDGDEWGTLAQNFMKRGYESVRLAYEYLEADGNLEIPKYIDSGVVLINQENVETYYEDLWDAITVKGEEWTW